MKCLVKGCEKDGSHARGLCRNHYLRIRLWIREGTVREEDLEKRGKILPRKLHRKTTTDLLQWVKEK